MARSSPGSAAKPWLRWMIHFFLMFGRLSARSPRRSNVGARPLLACLPSEGLPRRYIAIPFRPKPHDVSCGCLPLGPPDDGGEGDRRQTAGLETPTRVEPCLLLC